MKFLYVCEFDISRDDGRGINEREFIHVLREYYDKEVYCIVPTPVFPNRLKRCGLEFVINHKEHHPFFYIKYLLSLFRKILALNRVYNFDAFIFRLAGVPLVPLFVHCFWGRPIILKTLAGYQLFECHLSWKHDLLYGILFFPIYKLIIQKATVADTVSRPHFDWLNFRFGIKFDKMFMIPNGCNPDFFISYDTNKMKKKYSLDHFEYVIGYTGEMSEIRHIDKLLLATAVVAKKINVGLILIGKGKSENNLKELTKKLNIKKHVVFKGFIPYIDIHQYVSAFDISFDLSIIHMKIGKREIPTTFSQKVGQYLACGSPVVAWDIDDTKFIENENVGKIVPFADVDKLADSILKLFSMDEKEQNEMRKRARRYAEEKLSVAYLTSKRMKQWKQCVKKE